MHPPRLNWSVETDHAGTRAVEFHVPGIPAPQGSKSAFVTRSGRAVVVEKAGKKLYNWRDSIIAAALAVMDDQKPIEGPVTVTIDLLLPMPASRSKAIRELKVVYRPLTPDIDKLVRATLDGLTQGRVFGDDGQVVQLVANKYESTMWTGANILVEKIDLQPDPLSWLK